jgi:hypothetical protein
VDTDHPHPSSHNALNLDSHNSHMDSPYPNAHLNPYVAAQTAVSI